MKMRKWLRFGIAALIFGITLLTAPAAEEPTEQERIRLITRLTAEILSRNHYRQQPLNGAMSGQIFDEYFKTLDPGKYYFTQGDEQEFAPYRATLAARLLQGDAAFAFALYDRYRKRFTEYHRFAEERLKKPFDFTLDEELEVDRREAPRPADEQELHRLWELKLKNDVLTDRLFRRSLAEASEEKKEKPEKKDSAAETDLEAVRALWDSGSSEERILKRLRDLQNQIDQQGKLDILGLYLSALAQVYGPHSRYAPPQLDEDFEISMSLSLTGIGATLTSDDGYIKIVEIVPGGPADRSGKLHAEDRIIAVAQEHGKPVDVIDMSVSNAVKLIRGPAGSKVTLTVLPGAKGRQAAPELVTLVREKIELKDSAAQGEIREVTDSRGVKRRIGVIDLPSFYMDFEGAFRGDPDFRSCSRDVKKLLLDFRKQGVDAVVLDLRNNGGGSLPEAISLTGLFIGTGPVVQVQSSDRECQVQEDEDPSVSYSGPLVVLTNKLSASASEIFAGAIKDYQRGLVVGDSRTFGKGTVLDVMPLERLIRYSGNPPFPAGSTTYETAMFYRIAGGSVQQLGVTPDIQLPSLTEEMEIGELFSDYHLPWDSVPGLRYEKYDRQLPELLPELKRASEKRIAADPEYQKLLKNIDYFRQNKDRKKISLNEQKRYAEYLRNKEAAAAVEEESGEEPETLADRRKKWRHDAVLQEAERIAADYAALKLGDGKQK